MLELSDKAEKQVTLGILMVLSYFILGMTASGVKIENDKLAKQDILDKNTVCLSFLNFKF